MSNTTMTDIKNRISNDIGNTEGAINSRIAPGLAEALIYSALGAGAVGAGVHYLSRGEAKAPESILESDKDKEAKEEKIRALRLAMGVDKSMLPTSVYKQAGGGFWDSLGGFVDNTYRAIWNKGEEIANKSMRVDKPSDSAMYLPLVALGLTGGGYAGYKGLQKYLDEKEKEKQINYIKNRRKELDTLLADDLSTPEIEKISTIKKTAEVEAHVGNSSLNQIIGMYAIAAALLGGGGYLLGNNSNKNDRNEKLKAVKNQFILDSNQSNSPIELSPIMAPESIYPEVTELVDPEEEESSPLSISTSGGDSAQAPLYQTKQQALEKLSKLLRKNK